MGVKVDLAPSDTKRVFLPGLIDRGVASLEGTDEASAPSGPAAEALNLRGTYSRRGINPFLLSASEGDVDEAREAVVGAGDDADDDDDDDDDLVDVKIFAHLRDVIKIVGEEKF